MTHTSRSYLSNLAVSVSVALMFGITVPAHAQSVHGSVGVGGLGGGITGNANAGASIGGSGGTSGNANVSVGSTTGGNTNGDVSVNFGSGTGGTTNGSANVNIGSTAGSLDTSLGVGVGADVGTSPPGSSPPGSGISPPASGIASAISSLSASERVQLKKKCPSVLASPKSFSRDVVIVCRALAAL